MSFDRHNIEIVGRYGVTRSNSRLQRSLPFCCQFYAVSQTPIVLIGERYKCIGMFFGAILKNRMRRNFEFFPSRSDIKAQMSRIDNLNYLWSSPYYIGRYVWTWSTYPVTFRSQGQGHKGQFHCGPILLFANSFYSVDMGIWGTKKCCRLYYPASRPQIQNP